MAEKPSLISLARRWGWLPERQHTEAELETLRTKPWSSSPKPEDDLTGIEPEELPEQPETIREQLQELEDFAMRLVERAVVRGRAHPKGTGVLTEEEWERLAAPFRDELHADRQQVREMLRQAYIRGIERVHRELHGQPGIDNEMLDQAISFHSIPQDTSQEFK